MARARALALYPFCDAGIARVARPHIAFAVPADIAGLAHFAVATAGAVADHAQHLAVAADMQVLTVAAGADPQLTLGIERDVAGQVAHLHGLLEAAVRREDDETILLAVADPD